MKYTKAKLLPVFKMVVISLLGPAFLAGQASAAQAVIGMPFTGQWAYNTLVSPPYTDSNSSHPSVHHTPGGGDWATDVYAAEGTAVKLDVTYQTGTSLSFSWKSTSTTCGQSTGVNVIIDGTTVGWLYFAHLNNAVTSGTITNGMTLGTVHDWVVNGVECNPGVHVHIESKNISNYSCYADNGQPGVMLNYGTNFGVLGSSNTGAQQACSSIPSGGTSTTPRVTPLQYGSEMDIFKRGSNNSLWKDTIQSGSTSWSGWSNGLGGTFAGDPSADQYGSEMDVFVTQSGGTMYQNTYQPSTGSWSGWQWRANNMAGDPYSISYGGNLYVFSRGTDGNLYVDYWNGSSWSGAQETAGNGSTLMGSSPTAVVYGSEMDIYIRGTDSNLWKTGTTNGTVFGTLGSMGGGSLENDPKAITYGSEMDVYSNNTNGTLEKDTWNGSSWSGFNPLTGASFIGSPTAMQYGSSEMDVYDRSSSDSQIYKDTWQSGGTSWSGWNSLGGNEQGDPTALQWGTEMDVYATNYANNTDKDTWLAGGTSWSGFSSLL